MPGSPATRTSRPWPASASSRAPISSASSRSRPTNTPLAPDPGRPFSIVSERAGLAVGPRIEVQGRILHEDRLVELADRATGLDAQLLDQGTSRLLVGLERLDLPAGAVEGEHQLAAQALTQGLPSDQRLELCNNVDVTTGRKISVDPPLHCVEVQLLEARDLLPRERLVGKVRERRRTPQRQRVAQLLRCPFWTRVPRLGDQPFKPRGVQLGRVDPQDIAGRAGDEPALAELLAQRGDIHLDALGDRRGRRLAPQLVDQLLARDDLVGVEQQDREQRALLVPTQR